MNVYTRWTATRLVLLALIALPLLSACGGLKGSLVGRWRNDANEIVEFKSDGTAVMKTILGASEGYWAEAKETNEEDIDLQFSGLIIGQMTGRWIVRFEGNILHLIHPRNGATLSYVKM